MTAHHGAAPVGRAFRLLPPPPMMPRCVRDLMGLPACLGRMGSLEVRLATTKKEIRKAQRLRYKVFFEQGTAQPDRNFGFYSAAEFDIAPLLARHPTKRFLELGRSCVLKEYRTKRTPEPLWRGIWGYVHHHRIDVLIGCASLEGTDPRQLSLPLSFLHHHAAAADEWRAAALPRRYVTMNTLAAETIDKAQGARRAAAAGQGVCPPRRDLRRRRRERPAVRDARRSGDPAGRKG